MNIIKVEYDTYYPYMIENSWEQRVSCTWDDLKELKEELDKFIEQGEKKNEVSRDV